MRRNSLLHFVLVTTALSSGTLLSKSVFAACEADFSGYISNFETKYGYGGVGYSPDGSTNCNNHTNSNINSNVYIINEVNDYSNSNYNILQGGFTDGSEFLYLNNTNSVHLTEPSLLTGRDNSDDTLVIINDSQIATHINNNGYTDSSDVVYIENSSIGGLISVDSSTFVEAVAASQNVYFGYYRDDNAGGVYKSNPFLGSLDPDYSISLGIVKGGKQVVDLLGVNGNAVVLRNGIFMDSNIFSVEDIGNTINLSRAYLGAEIDGNGIVSPTLSQTTGMITIADGSSNINLADASNVLGIENNSDKALNINIDNSVVRGAGITSLIGPTNISLTRASTINGDINLSDKTDRLFNDLTAELNGPSINGNINFGGGNDVFRIGSTTTVVGTIDGGTGSDITNVRGLSLLGDMINFETVGLDFTTITGNVIGAIEVDVDASTVTGSVTTGQEFVDYTSANIGQFTYLTDDVNTASSISLSGGGTYGATSSITTGNINDRITLSEVEYLGNIDTGSGDDNVVLDDVTYGGYSILLGEGTNSFTATNGTQVAADIIGGTGADTFNLLNGAIVTGSIDAGAGDDIVNLTNVTVGDASTLQLGDGNDIINVNNATKVSGIDGSNGYDTINFNNYVGDFVGVTYNNMERANLVNTQANLGAGYSTSSLDVFSVDSASSLIMHSSGANVYNINAASLISNGLFDFADGSAGDILNVAGNLSGSFTINNDILFDEPDYVDTIAITGDYTGNARVNFTSIGPDARLSFSTLARETVDVVDTFIERDYGEEFLVDAEVTDLGVNSDNSVTIAYDKTLGQDVTQLTTEVKVKKELFILDLSYNPIYFMTVAGANNGSVVFDSPLNADGSQGRISNSVYAWNIYGDASGYLIDYRNLKQAETTVEYTEYYDESGTLVRVESRVITTNPIDVKPELLPEASSYASMGHGVLSMAKNQTQTLHRRIGEIRRDTGWIGSGDTGLLANLGTNWANTNKFSDKDWAIWSKGAIGGETLAGSSSNFGYSGNYYGAYMGLDYKLEMQDGLVAFLGLFGGTNIGDFETDGTGSSAGVKVSGKSDFAIDTWSAGIYGSLFHDEKTYLDVTAQYINLDVSMDSMGKSIATKGYAYAFSAEVGHEFDIADNIIIEPQAQLNVIHGNLDDFNDGTNDIQFNENTYFTGRIGTRLEASLEMFNAAVFTPWVEVNALYDYTDPNPVRYGELLLTGADIGLMGEVSAGGTFNLNDSFSIYGQADYGSTLGDYDYDYYRADLGVRINF